MSAAPDFADTAARLAEDMRALLHVLLGEKPTSRSRDTLRFRARGSLSVVVSGQRRGSWFDHEAGTGGDALGLVAQAFGFQMREARDWSLRWLGLDGGGPAELPPRRPPPKPRDDAPAADTVPLARRLWAEGGDPRGTAVEAYLRHRGLALPPAAPLRFHAECPRGRERLPAMLALMTDPLTGEPCGVHRTFLHLDGTGKAAGQAKMMAGHAGMIRLVPDAEVTQGLGLTEGIETALAVMQRMGWSPVWAATSAGAIARLPVLAGIEELTVFCDADDRGVGLAAAIACAERWAELARRVTIAEPPAGTDFDAATREAA